jgi:hypothetical protein
MSSQRARHPDGVQKTHFVKGVRNFFSRKGS